jgi:hypothetical protein
MNRIEFIDQLKAATGERIASLSRAGYAAEISYEDLDELDWITKQQLEEKISGDRYKGAWINSVTNNGGDVVDHKGTLWRSTTDGNDDEPGTTSNWQDILATQIQFKIPAGSDVDFYYSLAGTLLERGFQFKAEIIISPGNTTTNGATDITYDTSWANADWLEGVINPINGITIHGHPGDTGTLDDLLITLSKA